MFTVLGVTFKNKSEFSRALGYAYPISISNLTRDYGGSLDRAAITRLKMQGYTREKQTQLLQAAKDKYLELQRHGAKSRKAPAVLTANPADLTVKAAIRLSLSAANDETLQAAAISVGTNYSPDQIRAALQTFVANFDLVAAAERLLDAGEQ